MSGTVSYHAGRSAEDCVARGYEGRGMAIAARRWRGAGGEIDLVARDGDALVFVEVKQSRSFSSAAERVTRRQMDRVMMAAQEYLAGEPYGQLTDIRFDVALVNGFGEVDILENAFCA
ncbi:hypothetical protein CCR90_02755 [Rhodovulum sulfidophilum]|uniref:YraN family protein n=1 Tax=Rhodovulum sulfidophilum TaxID=35806 RepID=UPI001914A71D|nr:YraN family protein [Rhodovulum sulfidophilum]MBK5922714.1 hypothetical protein [Rhodovulum sulfidophilum]MCE8441997.1 YraN family protein [Rhodovulum sulfidophilum]MCE8458422.1 YraN family protein [Rhodovulum sulfidophilum]MCE8467942.1 YraN family protein [Rhodovulum sulfidophilum]